MQCQSKFVSRVFYLRTACLTPDGYASGPERQVKHFGPDYEAEPF